MDKTYLDNGKFKRSGDIKPDYKFRSPSDFFAGPTNLISGLGGVSGGRVLLGDKSIVQAISLIGREAPLVQSIGHESEIPFVEHFGSNVGAIHAKDDGKVTHVTVDEIKLKTHKGEESHELYQHHNLGRKSFLHNFPTVRVGDEVKKGDLLATSNYTNDKGHLALGVNLKTAVMPYRSANFEDAFVVTESGAKKLIAEQLIRMRVDKKFGVETKKSKFISIFPNKYSNTQLSRLDEDGVIKQGERVEHGDPVLLAYAPKVLKTTDIQLGKLSKVLRNAYRDSTETWDYDHPGDVIDVSKSGDIFTVNVKTVRGVQAGDKLSNSFGAKGVIGSILPDTQAPTTSDGKPVDLILNSMSITSRVSPALAVAMALGKYSEKIGKPVKMQHFTKESSVGKAIELLKKHDIKDIERLYDPASGHHIEALVGPLYTSRLVHIAEDKVSDRGQGIGYSINMQPTKSEGESAKRLGNLSTAALLSHGATAVLRDIGTIRATKNDDYWRRLKLGQPVGSPKVPFIFDKFIASLQGSGVKVDKQGDIFHILPQTDKDVEAISAGPIDNALTFKIKKDQMIPEVGGLFDPGKVGVLGEKYNHINLNMSVPNPISEEFLRKLLKVTQAQYEELVTSGKIAERLKDIDLDKEIAEQHKYLHTGKKTLRNTAVKLLSFLKTLKSNGMHPGDLMISKVPVIPAQYRPIAMQGDLVLPAPVNLLYKDLILNNRSLGNLSNVPDELKQRARLSQYNAVKAIYGLGEAITKKNQEKNVKGLLASMLGFQGGSAKGSTFQMNVVNKPIDLVGRAVTTPDANLDLDEASIPQEVIWKTFKPFVMRRLVSRGIPATKADEYIEAKNPLALNALNEELRTRPGILSRDPALHKFNLTGFYLKPNVNAKDKTIKLHPLVFKSFNLDADGDQMNVSVPVGEEARQEVIDKMLPSVNLLSPRNFAPNYVPSNEAALGIYQSSTEDNKNAVMKFKTVEEVKQAFNQGKLKVGDRVEVG